MDLLKKVIGSFKFGGFAQKYSIPFSLGPFRRCFRHSEVPGSLNRTILSGVRPYLCSVVDQGIISIGTLSSTALLSFPPSHFRKASKLASCVHSFALFFLRKSVIFVHGSFL